MATDCRGGTTSPRTPNDRLGDSLRACRQSCSTRVYVWWSALYQAPHTIPRDSAGRKVIRPACRDLDHRHNTTPTGQVGKL